MRLPSTLVACAVTLLAGLSACQRKEEPPPRAPPGPSMAERVQVLNADVYVIDGRHVRLADAAAPQPIPDARCWAEALAAKQATAVVRALIRDGHDIRIEPTGKTDAYNRAIAHVILDNQDLGRTLHDEGLVAETATGRFGWCEPVSRDGPGAPDLKSLMDLSRG